MVIKIGRDFEYKLSHISKEKKIKKNVIIDKIFDAFFQRYEKKYDKIKIPKRKKVDSDNWRMFEIYKKHYFNNFGVEYEVAPKNIGIDLRHIKKTKEKIVDLIVKKDTENVVAIDEDDLVNSYEYLLVNMPEWWRKNSFTTGSICKNLIKILEQIKNGQNRKDTLDNFINSL